MGHTLVWMGRASEGLEHIRYALPTLSGSMLFSIHTWRNADWILGLTAPDPPGEPPHRDLPAVNSTMVDQIDRFIEDSDIAGLACSHEESGCSTRRTSFFSQFTRDPEITATKQVSWGERERRFVTRPVLTTGPPRVAASCCKHLGYGPAPAAGRPHKPLQHAVPRSDRSCAGSTADARWR
jgi:hypothetical protein